MNWWRITDGTPRDQKALGQPTGVNVPNGVRHSKLQTAAAETVIFGSGVIPLPFEGWSA